MVETGLIIQKRYLLQRLLKQGQACAVYQGSDQVLQRAVAVKVAPPEHQAAYRAAIRSTSQFSHPNIIGIYDLIVEADKLYIVQEYVDGDDFGALLQTQQTPFQVVDLGIQICQALMYAAGPARKISHGDLTPATILRDRRGLVRVGDFALPSDLYYFNNWSVVGGDGRSISDRELPWGKSSEARKEDDTRAVGLLMYQLLMTRSPGASSVEPPTDGRLRFMRNVPAEVCELIARAVIRQHPQHITTADELHRELKVLAEALEPPPVPVAAVHHTEDLLSSRPYAPVNTGNLVHPAPIREGSQAGVSLGGYRPELNVPVADFDLPAAAASTVTEAPLKLATAHQAAYQQPGHLEEAPPRGVNVPILLLLGLVLFALFFVFGYFVASAIFH